MCHTQHLVRSTPFFFHRKIVSNRTGRNSWSVFFEGFLEKLMVIFFFGGGGGAKIPRSGHFSKNCPARAVSFCPILTANTLEISVILRSFQKMKKISSVCLFFSWKTDKLKIFFIPPPPRANPQKGRILDFLTTRFIAEKCFSNKTCGSKIQNPPLFWGFGGGGGNKKNFFNRWKCFSFWKVHKIPEISRVLALKLDKNSILFVKLKLVFFWKKCPDLEILTTG